jgi:hypothetical protein
MIETEPHTNRPETQAGSEHVGAHTDIDGQCHNQGTRRTDNADRPARTVQNVQKRTSKQPTKRRKPQKRQQTNIRREKLLAALPLHEWNITKAALAVGYGKYYARRSLPYIIKNDKEFCRAIDEKRKDIERRGDIEGTELVDRAVKLLDDPTTPKGVQARLLETLMKYKGMLTERRIIETVDRTAELETAEAAEAKRLASIRFRQTG